MHASARADHAAQQSKCVDGFFCSAIATAKPTTLLTVAIDALDGEQIAKPLACDIDEWHGNFRIGCCVKWR